MYLTALVASLMIFLVASAIYLRQPYANFAHPVTLYLLFHGFVFVVRPFFSYFYDFQAVYSTYNFQPSPSDRLTVIAGVNLAMISFLFVSMRIAPYRPAAAQGEGSLSDRSSLYMPVLIACGILLPFASWSQVSQWVRSTFEYDDMVLDQATGAFVNTTTTGWFTDLALSLAPIAIMLVWLGRYKPVTWVVLGLYAFSQAGTGVRGPLVYALAGVSMLYLIEKGRRWLDPKVLLVGALGLLAFNAIVTDRGAGVRALFDARAAVEAGAEDDLAPLEHMDFANLEYFEYLVYVVPQRSGSWDYFANNLQIFTEPIPRILWRDKPVGSPVQFYSLWDYGTPIGMTQSVPGVGWVSFGWLGIMIQAGVFAAIYSVAYRRLLAQRSDALAQVAYVLIAAGSLVIFRDGILLTFIRVLPFYIGPWLLVILIARLQGRTSGARRVAADDSRHIVVQKLTPAERRRALAEHTLPER